MSLMFQHFFEGATAKGARSTALHSLQWVLGMLLTGIPAAIWVGSPMWVIISLVVFLSFMLLTFVGSFLFLLIKDRDSLRSENYSLSKIALDRGLIGDNITGLLEESQRTKQIIDAKVVKSDERAES